MDKSMGCCQGIVLRLNMIWSLRHSTPYITACSCFAGHYSKTPRIYLPHVSALFVVCIRMLQGVLWRDIMLKYCRELKSSSKAKWKGEAGAPLSVVALVSSANTLLQEKFEYLSVAICFAKEKGVLQWQPGASSKGDQHKRSTALPTARINNSD